MSGGIREDEALLAVDGGVGQAWRTLSLLCPSLRAIAGAATGLCLLDTRCGPRNSALRSRTSRAAPYVPRFAPVAERDAWSRGTRDDLQHRTVPPTRSVKPRVAAGGFRSSRRADFRPIRTAPARLVAVVQVEDE